MNCTFLKVTLYLRAKATPFAQKQTTLTGLFRPSVLQTQRIAQYSPGELVLNEDEKKLLVKEGVNLPSKLPLTKVHGQDAHSHVQCVGQKASTSLPPCGTHVHTSACKCGYPPLTCSLLSCPHVPMCLITPTSLKKGF